MIIAQRSTEHKRTEHSQLYHCTVRFRSLVTKFSVIGRDSQLVGKKMVLSSKSGLQRY